MTDALQEMRYLAGGAVAHVVRPAFCGGAYPALAAYCGKTAAPMWWYGTRTEAEAQRVASLPMCKKCAKALP